MGQPSGKPRENSQNETTLGSSDISRRIHVPVVVDDDDDHGDPIVAVVRARLIASPRSASHEEKPCGDATASPTHAESRQQRSATKPSPVSTSASNSIVSSCSASSRTAPGSTSPTAHRTYVPDVAAGRIQSIDPDAPALHLPATADEFLAAGGLEPLVGECYALLRLDYPMLALRRLCLVEKLCDAAGLQPSLRERALNDRRIDAILRVERELEPTLAMMTDDAGWELIASKEHLSVRTYLRLLPGGRCAIKVTGILPQGVASVAAPLLHPELYSKWIPGVGQAVELSRPSNFRKLLYVRAIRIPMPFLAVRDAVVTGYGDVYSPTSVIVYLNDNENEEREGCETEEELAAVHKLSPPKQTVRMSLRGGFCFEILSGGGAPESFQRGASGRRRGQLVRYLAGVVRRRADER